MADTGVQVFIGPANQLELGDVVTGPAGVTLETIDDAHQRINFSIPSPTAELVAAQEATADAATTAAAAATAAQASAATAAADAAAAEATATTAAATADTALSAAQAAQNAVALIEPATDADLDAAVLRVITPATILIDTDGRPYFA